MSEPSQASAAVQALDRARPEDLSYLNAKSANQIRSGLVFGMLGLFALTVIIASCGALFGSSARWGQLSPVIDTVLAIEAAALGSAIAYYMAKQD
jgi:hypothetical protein